MRLGARWRAGAPPHPSVPAELHEAIAEVERAERRRTEQAAPSWTLTWLEGRPRCELGSTLVTLNANGEVVVTPRVAGAGGSDDGIVDDGIVDDDWLS